MGSHYLPTVRRVQLITMYTWEALHLSIAVYHASGNHRGYQQTDIITCTIPSLESATSLCKVTRVHQL